MIVLILVILIFILIAGILFLPASIVADSHRKMYFVSIPLYFKASFTESHEEWKIRLRIFQIPFNIKYLEKKKTSSQKNELKKRKKLSVSRLLIIIKKTFKSLRIKQLDATIDTGDFPLNAQLIPVISQLNSENIAITVNFEDNNSLYFKAVTRLYKFVWILIRYIIF